MKEPLEHHIESALNKEVDFRLPENFSERIMKLVTARANRERQWELMGIITTGILFVIALVVTIVLTEFKFSLGALIFLSNHLGLISFGMVFIVLLNILDRKLIKKQQTT